MTKDDLQDAIDAAAKGDLPAVGGKAFAFHVYRREWIPRPDCLTAYYSGGEAVLCSVLLAFYFEMYSTPDTLNYPEPRTWDKSPVDLIWPGAWWIVNAQNQLTDTASWDVIRSLLPGTKNA